MSSHLEIPMMDDEDGANNKIFIGHSFSEENERMEIKSEHIHTQYVYEVTFNWWGMELSPYQAKEMYEESKKGLLQLCEMMDGYLQTGESFLFYTSWMGEESNQREADITFPLQGWFEEGMELRERTLVKFVK